MGFYIMYKITVSLVILFMKEDGFNFIKYKSQGPKVVTGKIDDDRAVL